MYLVSRARSRPGLLHTTPRGPCALPKRHQERPPPWPWVPGRLSPLLVLPRQKLKPHMQRSAVCPRLTTLPHAQSRPWERPGLRPWRSWVGSCSLSPTLQPHVPRRMFTSAQLSTLVNVGSSATAQRAAQTKASVLTPSGNDLCETFPSQHWALLRASASTNMGVQKNEECTQNPNT